MYHQHQALIDLVLGSRIGYNEDRETAYTDTEIWKKGFINFNRYGLAGFMNAVSDKPYYLDKNRLWGSYYDLLNMIVPNPRIVIMVRDLRAIYASMEKSLDRILILTPKIMDNIKMRNITTDQRVLSWSKTQPILLDMLIKVTRIDITKIR